MKKINMITAASLFLGLSLGLVSCGNETFDLPTPPGQPESEAATYVSLTNGDNKQSNMISIAKNGQEAKITISLSSPAPKGGYKPVVMTDQVKLGKYISNYARTKGLPNAELLPADQYTVEVSTIAEGEKEGVINVKINNWEKMPYGMYYVPVVVMQGAHRTEFFVRVNKDGEYVALDADHQKPLPEGYPDIKKPMKMIAFVETNDWNPVNMGQFILEKSHLPVFDYVVFFAPNMNYDEKTGERYVFFNDKLEPMIKNPDVYIKPLTDRGIKVIFEILPNHQGVGYNNFQSYDEALKFAKKCKYWTDKLGIDGWDIDEEYAEYQKLPSYPYNENSGFWYCKAMKEVMPDKLLTLYNFNSPVGANVAPYIDFVYADYGVNWKPAWVKSDIYAGSSVECNRGISEWSFANSATINLRSGNGGLMIFSLHGTDIVNGRAAKAISGATQKFYGEKCIFSGKYYPGARG